MTWTDIDISGKTGISFKGLFAANSTNTPWDNTQTCTGTTTTTNTDYIIVQYRIDGGPYVDLIRFFNSSNDTGSPGKYLSEDLDGDGCGDGSQLTNVFSEFTKTIPGTGTTLDLRLNVYSEGNNEEWGVDNFRLFETPALVNGACGSASAPALVTAAPSANLCSAGTPSSVLAGTTAYTWSCTGSGGGTDDSCSAGRGYTVTPSAGANGSISPNTAQVVAYNATPAFTVTPSSNYSASVGGSCGGALSGSTYTTNAVTADCTVAASFTFVADTTPDAFSFTAQNAVAVSTVRTSDTITVSGVNTSTPISVTGGEYQINSGGWTSTAGSVNNGDSVTVRHTASAAFSTTVTTTLTIGGVTGDFSSTTAAPPVVNGACGSASAPALVTAAPSANLCSAGTPGSVLAGTTAYTWSCTGSGGGTNDSCSAGRGYTVTPSAGANGSISPNTAQVVAYNATPAFTVTPSSNYSASVGGSCGGALSGGTYTTNAVTADCTVAASFTFVADTTPDAFSFTAQNAVAVSSVRTSDTITVSGVNTSTPISVTGGEYQINSGGWTSTAGSVNNGDSVTVRHTASAAFSTTVTTTLDIGGVSAGFSSTTTAPPVVNGACGSASAPALVTAAPSANLCSAGTPSSVLAGTTAYTWGCTGSGGGTSDNSCSAGRGYTVTPSAGANGSISPNTAQVVAYNATPAFTVTPDSGFTGSVGGTCGGALVGNTYTTNAVTAHCTVAASAVLNTSYTATAPGGSVVSTQLGGGGSTCGFTAVGYQSAASVGGTPPAGYAFPHGVLAFTTSGSCTPDGTVTLTLTYPSALPAGTKFFKYGPATAGASPTWYEHPATISADTITYSVKDNGLGDNDDTPGLITDPAGAAVPLALSAAAIPTMAQWVLMLLAGLLLGLGLLHPAVRRPAA